jgi:phosphoribosylformylglycinamidine (FGAM) synthase-like amidotransferase family enzyme
MKRIFLHYLILFACLVVFSNALSAQNVGIGTSSPTAQMHVNGTVRLENLPLNNTNNIVLGMDASGNLARRTADFWSLTGNTGTNAATNFLGNIDNIDFAIRVADLERVRVSNLGAFVVGGGFSANTVTTSGWSTLVSGYLNSVNNADKSIVLGWLNSATAHNQYLIGVNNTATNEYGFTIGLDLRSNADKAFVIGTGQPGNRLSNSNTHSLLIGFNGSNSLFINNNSVGVNTITPTARLHVKADATRGIRFETLPQGTSDSALVIDAAGNVKWKTITGGGSSGWSLTGNTGTNATTNFLGNTDNIDFAMRVANLERVRVTTNGAFVVGGGFSANTVTTSGWSTLVSGYLNSVNNADKSIVLGWLNSATAHNQYLIGVNNTATNEYGFTIGLDLRSNADKAFVIGTGQPGNRLSNSNTHSLLIGFTGSQSLFINNVAAGVFTTTPTQRFHVKCDTAIAGGGIRFENLPAGTGYYLTVDNNGVVMRSNLQSTARLSHIPGEEINALRKELEEARKEIEWLKQRMDRLLPQTTQK